MPINFPSNPATNDVYTYGGRSWKYNGTGWETTNPVAANAGGDLTGTYPSPTIATGAVTSAKIADGTIATGDIADSAVTSAKIADGTIATGDIADNAVTTAKIAANAITSANIANNAVGGSQLATGAKNIVSTTKTDTYVMTSTTFTDVTGLSVTITPTATSSKILIVGYLSGMGAAAQTNFFARLTRGGTAICVGNAAGSRVQCTIHAHDNNAGHAFGFNYLDSPNTTSATTYSMQIRSQTSGYGVTVNRTGPDGDGIDVGRTASTITAIEVLA